MNKPQSEVSNHRNPFLIPTGILAGFIAYYAAVVGIQVQQCKKGILADAPTPFLEYFCKPLKAIPALYRSTDYFVELLFRQERELVEAAEKMAMDPKSFSDGSPPFPRESWPAAVRNLKPITVYPHLANVVIATYQDGKIERGYYVNLRISSFIPFPGSDPEWNWKPRGYGLYEYQRKRSKVH